MCDQVGLGMIELGLPRHFYAIRSGLAARELVQRKIALLRQFAKEGWVASDDADFFEEEYFRPVLNKV